MPDIIMYTTSTCPYCRAAKQLLESKGAPYTEILVRTQIVKQEMVKRSGRHTVPQIFIGDQHISGFDDLARLDREGRLTTALRPRKA
ncbi:glutaredoxin 3 [Pseudomonas helmanticensis]|uniref:Glutaredoxin 3 n=1 Tax=Pseudomonas helmanticensis TaxID=1471381 RepID=A0ACD2UDE6_9PSED|nr:glutaredoxin 3 [Pseudomonas helmanticensis]SMQ30417.1 glutaredoxin 3 [Pseudomonas helmanticensis]